MSNPPVNQNAPEMPDFAPRLYGIAALVGAIILIGLWLVSRFAEVDLARDLQTWQEKLNLIAESRSASVEQWVGGHFKELHTLADNPSLQLYMTELQPSKDQGEPPQRAYLRNLLVFTAERTGFAAPVGTAAIPANVQTESKNALAILNAKGDIVVSTVMTSDTRDAIIAYAKSMQAGKEGLIDLRKDKNGEPVIGFIAPIYSIQGEHNANAQIGTAIGVKTVDANLFGLLKHPGTVEKTLESVLLRSGDGGKIEYLSPLLDGTEALSKEAAPDPAKSAEAKLMQTVGDFTSDLKDYRDRGVLATSRAIAGTPWILVVKIDRQEALSPSADRRASMVTFFFLLIAIIVLIIISIWWHANSKRALIMSQHFKRLANWAMAQEQLLRLVADNQPEPIYIVDASQIMRFANKQAATEAGMSLDSMPGKTLSDLRGTARALQISEQCERALKNKRAAYDVQRINEPQGEIVLRSAYVPLDHIPIITLPEPTPGVLVVEQDISEVVHEREQRLATHRRLVDMLVKLVDARDPFAANHSLLVSHIAHEVAVDMELDNVTVDTAVIAGSLMNIGKIVVPPELLTKTERLSDAEKRTIQDSMNAAADLLKDIHFDGPVADTLRQWQEKWDGGGPLGLSGESILITARIIGVANAFIGMISPRAFRNAMPIDAASKYLLDNAGKAFDRRVVIALIHYIENQHGKEWIRKVLENQKDVA